MKIAIVYKSLTGNTKLVANAINEALGERAVYFGEPNDSIDADFYFVGSWTDKGMCCGEIKTFLETLQNKKLAYFATAGFGGSQEYYDSLFERVKSVIPDSNEIAGGFFCQGKMPISVRDRYVSMMQAHPDDKKLEVSIKNFDNALSHPNYEDLQKVKYWTKNIAKH